MPVRFCSAIIAASSLHIGPTVPCTPASSSAERTRSNAAFVIVRGTSVKARHLRRDPRCTVLAVTEDWRGWVSVEGEAQLFEMRNTEAEQLRHDA